MYRVFIVVVLFVVSCKNQEKSIKLTDYASMTLLEKSNSNTKPKPGDFCLIEYVTEYNDSTYDYSTDVNPDGVTMEFNENEAKNNGRNQFLLALKEMNEGDSVKIKMNLPNDFLEQSKLKNMPTREYLISNLKLKKIMSQNEAAAFNAAFSAKAMLDYQQYKKNDSIVGNMVYNLLPNLNKGDNSDFKSLPSGVFYKIISNGNNVKASGKDGVRFHACAYTLGGKKLGSTFEKAAPEAININSGKLLPVFKDGLKLVGEGGNAIVFLPIENSLKNKDNQYIYYLEIVNVRKH